jgi:LysM repeat protein
LKNAVPTHHPSAALWAAAFAAVVAAAVPAGARPLPSAAARPLALGNAYTAEDQDVNSLFFNPAGLTGLTAPQLSLNYGRMDFGGFSNATDVQGAFGRPASFQGLPIVAAGGFAGQSYASGVHVFDLFAGAGTAVPTRGLLPWPVRGGGVLKIRQQKGGDKDSAVGKTELGFGLDGGLLMEFSEAAAVGVALRDLFPSGLHPAGPQLRLGGRYLYQQKVLLLADVEARRNVTALHVGTEWLFYRDLLRLRVGNGYSAGGVDHFAVGAGFNFSPAQIDVAYLIPTHSLNDSSDQFRVSLIYRFNAPRFSELYYDRALDLADELDRRIEKMEERETALKGSVDDLEQAKRLAEEDMARASVRRTESQQELDNELLKARTRVTEAERRAQDLEEKVRDAEEKIRRAERLGAPRPPAAPAKPAIRTHRVEAGDSLRSLAEKYYKDAERWKTIYNANLDKIDRGRLIPGSELVIPE